MLHKEGDLYVSSKEGHVVARFGSGTAQFKAQPIGVYPVVETQKDGGAKFVGLRWDVDEVVRIPRAEYLAHLKAYDQEISAGALLLRTKAEHEAFLEKQAADSKAAKEASDAAAKEAREADAKKEADEKAAVEQTKATAALAAKKES